MMTILLWTLALSMAAEGAERPDVLIADFEGADYGAWKVEGEAFGPGPAHGTLPNQMDVSGFEGKGLVSSYYRGDGTTGRLVSPPFKLERKFLSFLIGGGMHPGETCINLLSGGAVVRTATGPNDKPGGTERLDWHTWDLSDLEGKEVVLEIVDRNTGGWGHINIDQIVQSDRRRGMAQASRDIALEQDYLSFCFPAGQAARCRITLEVDGKTVRESAGAGREKPSWLTWDISRLKGKKGKLTIAEVPDPDGICPLAQSVRQGGEVRGGLIVVDRVYEETYRPQFHFTPMYNWTNDPNGCVYYKGEYHLFFQHNPAGIEWGNMTWGHAVSPDMVRWKQLDHAIRPDDLGTIFSGSAVVDWKNTAGFQTGDEKVLVAVYTSAGSLAPKPVPFTQSIAYSNDRGRTWVKHAKNPVLGHVAGDNRDPKVIWHEPTGKWVMALFLDGNAFALFGSKDLKEWTKLCDVPMPGSGECPDFFELAADGDPAKKTWLFWAANGNYRLGTFDGTTFKPETDPLRSEWGSNSYAAQTWSDIPPSDGRRLQIAWMAGGKYPGMPFNQQMTFPRELTLRATPEGVRLFINPAREIEGIRGAKREWSGITLAPGQNPISRLEGDLWEIAVEFSPGTASEVVLDVRGEAVRYDVKGKTLHLLGKSAPLEPTKGRIRLRALVDRASIEIFANDGRVTMSSCFLPDVLNRSLALRAVGGTANIESLEVWQLESIWPRNAGSLAVPK